jgi:hypothetical protein
MLFYFLWSFYLFFVLFFFHGFIYEGFQFYNPLSEKYELTKRISNI